MTDVSARFYVIATSGYGLGHSTSATSYAVLDRLWAHREVYSAPVSSGGPLRTEPIRRARCERVAEALNARHEQHMREVVAA